MSYQSLPYNSPENMVTFLTPDSSTLLLCSLHHILEMVFLLIVIQPSLLAVAILDTVQYWALVVGFSFPMALAIYLECPPIRIQCLKYSCFY